MAVAQLPPTDSEHSPLLLNHRRLFYVPAHSHVDSCVGMRPVITLLQLCFFANAWFVQGLLVPQHLTFTPQLEYTLSNHGASNNPQSIFSLTRTADSAHNDNVVGSSSSTPTYSGVHAVPTTIYRPRSVDSFLHARLRSFRHSESETIEWERIETLGPNVQDRHTLTQLARMSGNAYALPGQSNWYDVDLAWNIVSLSHEQNDFMN